MHEFIGRPPLWAKHAALLLAIGMLQQFAPLGAAAQDAPKRPRITGIDHVRLYVSDMNKSHDFYYRQIHLATTAVGACRTRTHPCLPVNNQQQLELESAPSPAPKNWVAEIAYATDGVEQLRSYLLSHAIQVNPIIQDPNGTRHFQTHDPEGNQVAFVQHSVGFGEWMMSTAQVGTHLIHAGFVVKNVAAENKFYVDLLGFKLYWQGGFKDDGLDWYEIQVPDGPDWIEYMLNIPANADHKELGVQNHFSLGVIDIHAAADQLHKNGIAKFDGPEIGRDGKWGLDAYDPDGTRVEVMEFTPAREPCCHPYTAPHPQP